MSNSDREIALAFETAIKPFILYLYSEAELDIPEGFVPATEGPRLVAALREQGYATHFSTRKGKEIT